MLKIGRKEPMTRVIRDPFINRNVKGRGYHRQASYNAATENQPYLRNGKSYTNFKLGICGRNTMTRITGVRVTSDLIACSSHHALEGGGGGGNF